jgi:Uncharacterized enzyme involved in inositol metabolism
MAKWWPGANKYTNIEGRENRMNKYNNMFGYPEFDENGVKEVTTTTGDYKDMLMNIYVYKFKAGEVREFYKEDEETAILLLSGEVELSWGGRSENAGRIDPFVDGAYCLHVCKGNKITVKALSLSEVLIQSTVNDREFPYKYYKPEDIKVETFGQSLCAGTAVRSVTTIFDYNTAPYSNMVIGEIFNQQGHWSSYIPHSHDQPEVYYYRFDKPQGFGACFIGDNAFKIKNGSFCAIPGGLTHPQVAAPGYRMTYVWMIRHFDGNPWNSRVDDKDHLWMVGTEF